MEIDKNKNYCDGEFVSYNITYKNSDFLKVPLDEANTIPRSTTMDSRAVR